jgi:hypothetical protein
MDPFTVGNAPPMAKRGLSPFPLRISTGVHSFILRHVDPLSCRLAPSLRHYSRVPPVPPIMIPLLESPSLLPLLLTTPTPSRSLPLHASLFFDGLVLVASLSGY